MYNQITANKRRTSVLMLLFLSLVIALGYVGDVVFQGGNVIFYSAIILSLVMTWVSYYYSDKIAIASVGAKQITETDNPYVYRMVQNLAIASGLPMPKVYIIPSPALNAFATGRDPEHASVAVTSGIIDALENEELEGVLAHELSHIKNYDIRVMTIVVTLVGVVSIFTDIMLRGMLYRDRDSKVHPAVYAVALVLIILSPIIATLIQLAISRRREFLADASGALMTRYPEGLARALEKISSSSIPLEKAGTATAHLFISEPRKTSMVAKMFSTHPPAEERIKALRSMM